jgi:cytochrome c-type biogenesis protein CcmE
MTPRQKRTYFIVGGILTLSVATFFVLRAFNENLVFFYTPSQIKSKEAPINKDFRIGGMVVQDSLKREPGGLKVQFMVTDTVQSTAVEYNGILPDLFKEGKGVVAQGKLNEQGVFIASQVLAKHDENYMPPEAKSAIAAGKANQEKISQSLITDGK